MGTIEFKKGDVVPDWILDGEATFGTDVVVTKDEGSVKVQAKEKDGYLFYIQSTVTIKSHVTLSWENGFVVRWK